MFFGSGSSIKAGRGVHCPLAFSLSFPCQLKARLFGFNIKLNDSIFFKIPGKKTVLPALLLSLFAVGCAKKPGSSVHLPTSPVQKKQAREKIKELITLPSKIKSFSAFAKISVTIPGKKKNVKESIVIDRFGNMRLETLNPFGQISVLLVKQGGKILFYNLMENKYMLTDDKSPILKEVLGVPISLEEVKSILLQDFFTGASNPFRKNPVTEKEEGGFRVEYTRHVKEFYLNRDGMVGSVGFFDLSGKPLFVASYSRYVRVSDLLFPSKIGVTFPAEGIKLLFSLRDVSVNREIEPDLFVLDLPEKAVRYR